MSKRSRVLPLLVLAAVTPLFVPATPSPTPSAPLPEIGRVRSNALCTTLRENIAPTILGLIKNDEIIGAGHRAFAKMSHDMADSAAAIEIDQLYLQQVETRIVHNLGVIDKMLGDGRRFPANPKNDDERDANSLRAQLLAVADSQRRALDIVSGTLATESLGQMQHDLGGQAQSAVGQPQPQTAATSDPTTFLGTAGLPEYSPVAGLPTTASKMSSVSGHTVYDSLGAALEARQATTARREQVATTAVIGAVGECRATVPTPTPGPSAAP